MTNPTIRNGDTVLVRARVVPSTQGSTSELHPAIQFVRGLALANPNDLEIVTVEQAFRVGDIVRLSSTENGTIVALSPTEVQPPQAWIREPGKWPLTTRALNTLSRVEQ